jgi:hypothetical protein
VNGARVVGALKALSRTDPGAEWLWRSGLLACIATSRHSGECHTRHKNVNSENE